MYKRQDNYESIIPEDLRWRNWAKADSNGHAMTGDKLLNFVNNSLFPVLKGNDVKEGDTIIYEGIKVTPGTPIKKAIVKSTFEDANNYMKDGVYLRQVIDVLSLIHISMSLQNNSTPMPTKPQLKLSAVSNTFFRRSCMPTSATAPCPTHWGRTCTTIIFM